MGINSTRLPFRSLVYHGLTAVGVILGIIALSSCAPKENPLPTPSPKPKEVETIKDQAYADKKQQSIYGSGRTIHIRNHSIRGI